MGCRMKWDGVTAAEPTKDERGYYLNSAQGQSLRISEIQHFELESQTDVRY